MRVIIKIPRLTPGIFCLQSNRAGRSFIDAKDPPPPWPTADFIGGMKGKLKSTILAVALITSGKKGSGIG